MESIIYSTAGKATGKIELPKEFFGLSWNADLVHQVATSLATNKRTPVAHTKDRGEVRGGGKKPWRQKGTGRARHGSIRSPLWVGGGVAHGPRNEKNFSRKVSKKMKEKALYTILSRKFLDGEILLVDSLGLPKPKTKEALTTLKNLSSVKGFEKLATKKKNAALFVTADKKVSIEKSVRNIGSLEVVESRNLTPLDLLKYKFLVIENPSEAFKKFPSHGQRN